MGSGGPRVHMIHSLRSFRRLIQGSSFGHVTYNVKFRVELSPRRRKLSEMVGYIRSAEYEG